MISKCANPKCGKAFDHREGRFFRFRQNLKANEPANAHSVRHFWLCGNCSEEYSLEDPSRSCQVRAKEGALSASAGAVREAAVRLVPRAHLSPEAVEV